MEQCFALSATPFTIRYKDDDGEVTDVTSDGDLTEAIHYFHVGDDPPTSSASSVTSGRSTSGRKVTLRLTVVVDYELSLSDTASLASLEEYDDPNASDLTLARAPLNGYHDDFDVEDDAVTVSSRDTTSISRGVPALRIAAQQNLRSLSPVISDDSPPTSSPGTANEPRTKRNVFESPTDKKRSKPPDGQGHPVISQHSLPQTVEGGAAEGSDVYEKAPTGVFDRLKQLEGEELGDLHSSLDPKRLSQTERGVQWLRDQNVRAIQSMFGALPEPSVSGDTDSVIYEEGPEEVLAGDLALQQDPRGKYYYTYTSSSGASQIQEETFDHLDGGSDAESVIIGDAASRQEEPSPHGLAWLADQRTQPSSSTSPTNPFTKSSSAQIRERYQIHPDIPAEVLKFVPEHRLPLLPPEMVTSCFACGLMLESFRYVCTTCGELEPHSRHSLPLDGKGKGKAVSSNLNTNPFVYYSETYRATSSSPSSSSWTLLGSPDLPPRSSSLVESTGKPNILGQKPLPASSSQDTLFVPSSGQLVNLGSAGYELCSSCIESAGVLHALEAGASTSPLSHSPVSSSQEDIRAIVHLRRTAPRSKGHIRHAYREKVWGREGWKDVGE